MVGLHVSYRDQYYSVLPCSNGDTILVLPTLTPAVPRSRIVMTSQCKQWFLSFDKLILLLRLQNELIVKYLFIELILQYV